MPVAPAAKYSAGKPKKPIPSSQSITTVAIRPEKLFEVSYRPAQNRDDLPKPVGYNPNVVFASESQSKGTDADLIVKEDSGLLSSRWLEWLLIYGMVLTSFISGTSKRSWDIALAPIKQVPMNLFIMWMSGNAISIFPIMMVVMMFFKPVKAIFSAQSTFKTIEGRYAPVQKLVYLLGNCVALAIAVYKCNSMGLLPTQPSDWLSFEKPLERVEFLAGGGM